jgi:curved DNA-binding protein CbpA
MVVLSDPYKVLNLPHSATGKEIKQSYRQLARKFHPDTWSLPCFSPAERQQATEKFTEISNAYSLLSDEKDKAEYDRTYKYGGYDTKPAATKRPEPAASRPYAAPAPPPPRSPYPASPHRSPYAAPPPPRTPYKPTPAPPQPRVDVWTTAVDPSTGRSYYYNKATGQAAPPPSLGEQQHDYRNLEENPAHIRHRVDSHPFAAFLALLTCPPIGLLALYHSRASDTAWEQGRYSQAVHHARQVPQFSCLSHVMGIGFWIYWLVLREGADFDFDFDWGEP